MPGGLDRVDNPPQDSILPHKARFQSLENMETRGGLHPQSETAKMGTLSQRMGGDCLYAESDLWRGLQNGCGGTDTQGRKLLGGGARAGSEAQAAVRMEG